MDPIIAPLGDGPCLASCSTASAASGLLCPRRQQNLDLLLSERLVVVSRLVFLVAGGINASGSGYVLSSDPLVGVRFDRGIAPFLIIPIFVPLMMY